MWWLCDDCSGSVPTALATLPRMHSLNLSSNSLTGCLDKFAGALPPSNSLVSVDLSHNRLRG